MIEKVIIFNIFKYFIKHEMMQKVISCVMIFFILISLINIRKIEVEVGLVKESVEVTVETVTGQVSFIYRIIYLEGFSKIFVRAKEEVELNEQIARREVEKIIAKEIKLLEARFIEGEGARGSDRGEQTVEGNSLMASVGYLMLTDIYEMGIGIKEAKRDGDRFSEGKGIIKRDIEIE